MEQDLSMPACREAQGKLIGPGFGSTAGRMEGNGQQSSGNGEMESHNETERKWVLASAMS